jgi:hypothetical protein
MATWALDVENDMGPGYGKWHGPSLDMENGMGPGYEKNGMENGHA